jgi:hypothetical protein
VEPDNHPSGAKLLFTDAEVADRVLNEFRHRIIARTLGIQSRESSFSSLLITMIAIGAAAQGIQGAGTKVRKVQSSPTLGDALIGGTIVKQSVLGVAGATSQDTAVFGALIVFAIVARSARPVLAGTYRGVRAQRRRFRAVIRGRYGGKAGSVALIAQS